MLVNDRQQLRQIFFNAWRHYQQNKPLNDVEQQAVDVILIHPEYHALLNQVESQLDKDFHAELGESNPFMHMSMHIAVRDQIKTNLPEGIKDIFQQLLVKYHADAHQAEHHIMEVFGQVMWQVLQGHEFDPQQYLASLLDQK